MKLIPKEIEEVFEIQLEPKEDERGFFMRTYDDKIFKEWGLDKKWVHENHSLSKQKHTIRGMHFQFAPDCETKLLRIVTGEAFFAIIDLRKDSPTFGKYTGVVLSGEKRNMLYVPKGCANGMCTLTDNVHLFYKVDSYYSKDNECSIKWDDLELGIKWPITSPAVISARDQNAISFREFKEKYKGIEIKKKIFITGGTGFIGTPLMKKLDNGKNEILLLIHPSQNEFLDYKNVKIIKGDLSNVNLWKDEVKKFAPDVTVHLAWEGIPYDYGPEMSSKNLSNSLNLIHALSETSCRKIICTGTQWEYGVSNGELSEEQIPQPYKPLALAKHSLYKLASELTKEKGISFIWARIFYVYGPGKDKITLVPYIIDCAKNNLLPKLNNQNLAGDFIYVDDVADALFSIINKCNKSSVYNIGTGSSVVVKDIAKLIYSSLGKSVPLEIINAEQTNISNTWANISKLKAEIGWEPKISLEEGIKRTITYYNNF